MSKVLLSWETPEYFPKERPADWYWAVGIIAAALIITAVLLNNLLLAVFLAIATFTIFIYAKRQPEIITVQITENGIRVGNNLYAYPLLKSFWIRNEGMPELLLESGSILNPIIIVPMINVEFEVVQQALAGRLVEEEIQEPLIQKLMEYLGF